MYNSLQIKTLETPATAMITSYKSGKRVEIPLASTTTRVARGEWNDFVFTDVCAVIYNRENGEKFFESDICFNPERNQPFYMDDVAFLRSSDEKFIVSMRKYSDTAFYMYCECALPLGEGHYKFEQNPDDEVFAFKVYLPPSRDAVTTHSYSISFMKSLRGVMIRLEAGGSLDIITAQPCFLRVSASNTRMDEIYVSGDFKELVEHCAPY